MAVLGDEQASGIRRMLLSAGAFSEIHAFPQKDNPSRRVFRDAKLSTDAESCQVILDKLMLSLLGLGANKHDYLRTRLAQML